MTVFQDAVKTAVMERLQVLQSLASRLEKLLQSDGLPPMQVCRLALDADAAAAKLADHATRLEATR